MKNKTSFKNNNEKVYFDDRKLDCIRIRKGKSIKLFECRRFASSYLQRRSSMLERPVHRDRREVFLIYLPGTLGWLTVISKKEFKKKEDRWNQCALPADWSVCVPNRLAGRLIRERK